MREEKPKIPSQKNKSTKRKSWFWPAVYLGAAVLFVGMIWGYTILTGDSEKDNEVANGGKDGLVIETNAPKEVLKFPFPEALIDEVVVLQDYYDMEADEATREKALLVFNQQFVTNTGLTLSVDGKPFEVVAAMSGVVEEVVTDPYAGNEIRIAHADGMVTVYGSVTGILVQKGDEVVQGQPLATASENEWNPTAGIHLHFQVLKDGEHVNPRSYLGFN